MTEVTEQGYTHRYMECITIAPCKISSLPWKPSVLHIFTPLLPQPLTTTDLVTISIVLLLPRMSYVVVVNFYYVGIFFSDWLLSFNNNTQLPFLPVFSFYIFVYLFIFGHAASFLLCRVSRSCSLAMVHRLIVVVASLASVCRLYDPASVVGGVWL